MGSCDAAFLRVRQCQGPAQNRFGFYPATQRKTAIHHRAGLNPPAWELLPPAIPGSESPTHVQAA